MGAAERNGYVGDHSAAAARSAIRSGLRNGLRSPRPLPSIESGARGVALRMRRAPADWRDAELGSERQGWRPEAAATEPESKAAGASLAGPEIG